MTVPANLRGDFSCPKCKHVSQSADGFFKAFTGLDTPWKVTCICGALFQVSKFRVTYLASGPYGNFPRKPSPNELQWPPAPNHPEYRQRMAMMAPRLLPPPPPK